MLVPHAALTVSEGPNWADKLEAWSTFAGAAIALAAASFTFWLLVHQIRETNRARSDAGRERAEAARDRELARQDRELAASERRDAEMSQARTIIVGGVIAEAVRMRPGDELNLRRVTGWLANFGSQPVTDVVFVIARAGASDVPVDATTVEHASVLAPSNRIEVTWELPAAKPSAGPIHVPESYIRDEGDGLLVRVEARSTDIAGRRWIRVNKGQPERVLG